MIVEAFLPDSPFQALAPKEPRASTLEGPNKGAELLAGSWWNHEKMKMIWHEAVRDQAESQARRLVSQAVYHSTVHVMTDEYFSPCQRTDRHAARNSLAVVEVTKADPLPPWQWNSPHGAVPRGGGQAPSLQTRKLRQAFLQECQDPLAHLPPDRLIPHRFFLATWQFGDLATRSSKSPGCPIA